MFSSYKQEDVEILLKDITGMVTPMSTKEREIEIQKGRSYCEMLPIEYEPSELYLKTYYDALERFAGITAEASARVAEKILADKGKNAVLISLARAGTPIGIIIKRYLKKKYNIDVKHYTISIIRGVGIDDNAMKYILTRHKAETLQFVDGWTGKGAIQRELRKALKNYPGVDDGLAVLSDPAHIAKLWGTHEDFLIASSCLNSTVSGLLSRTFFRRDIIGNDDFHGSAFYKELADRDLTYQFIDTVENYFPEKLIDKIEFNNNIFSTGLAEVENIAREFSVENINLVKPGIGEATRVLLRRVPWKILVHSLNDENRLGHIYQLAKEKEVEVVEYPLQNYLACGIIRTIADN